MSQGVNTWENRSVFPCIFELALDGYQWLALRLATLLPRRESSVLSGKKILVFLVWT